MQISHEVPLKLLETSRLFNDYDYALVHLFKDNLQYYKFYENSLNLGRVVILDNSAYELGKSIDLKVFSEWVVKLKPTYYIIPDDKKDMKNDRDMFDSWRENFETLCKDSKSIGVVHGSCSEEFIENYNYIKDKVDKIAISTESFFKDYGFECENEALRVSSGRSNYIDKLVLEGVIDTSKPHHILGCILPQSFKTFKKHSFIDTIDTSNPVLHGLLGIRYETFGLSEHSSTKLADLLNCEINVKQLCDIFHNVKTFRDILK